MTSPWPFSKRGASMSAQANFQPMKPLEPAQFANADAVIKLWLTEPVVEAIDLISIENDNSRPDVLRSILFEHIYGSAALVQFIQWRREQEFAQDSDHMMVSHVGARYSATRRNADFETMGKANQDFKLHLAEVMRSDLDSLARSNGLTMGDYCRRVLVAHLFGMRHVEQWPSIA
jgi:hypothetical protein